MDVRKAQADVQFFLHANWTQVCERPPAGLLLFEAVRRDSRFDWAENRHGRLAE